MPGHKLPVTTGGGGSSAAPFVKWAGGKRQLLAELLPRVPSEYGSYYEPFVGGGALFFELQPRSAVLSDANAELIRAYIAIRDSPERVIALLERMEDDEDYYMAWRERPVAGLTVVQSAVRLLVLTRLCYSGLYRVNKAGQYNVPYGRSHKRRRRICNPERVRACSAALRGVQILCADFETAVMSAVAYDAVYFDPPYVPASTSANFKSYTAQGFTMQDQVRLRDTAVRLRERGVTVILSNSATPEVEQLYGTSFALSRVQARRSINCRGSKRGPVDEYIIC